MIGLVVAIDEAGRPLVSTGIGARRRPVAATTLESVGPGDIGRRAVLQFEEGDPRRPILVGLLAKPVDRNAGSPGEVTVDGERIRLKAAREVILECGKARITLTNAGKVIIEGAYLSSRSTGPNRIRGGTVQIN